MPIDSQITQLLIGYYLSLMTLFHLIYLATAGGRGNHDDGIAAKSGHTLSVSACLCATKIVEPICKCNGSQRADAAPTFRIGGSPRGGSSTETCMLQRPKTERREKGPTL